MPRLTRLLLVLAATLSCLGSARAEGLVQLTLSGAIREKAGSPVEIRWAVHVMKEGEGEVKEAGLRLHLASGTTAHDLATLLVARLRKQGAKVTFPAEKAATKGAVQIFVESTTLLSLRLAPGLSSTLTACDSAPNRVRFLKPLLHPTPAMLTIGTSTFHAHTKMPGNIVLNLDLDPMRPVTVVSETLFELGLANELVGDRPSADSWRPVKSTAGASITGCSLVFDSKNSDWGLELQLEVPKQQ